MKNLVNKLTLRISNTSPLKALAITCAKSVRMFMCAKCAIFCKNANCEKICKILTPQNPPPLTLDICHDHLASYLSHRLFIVTEISPSLSQHLHEHRHQGYLNLMMKVTPLAPWSSISFFKDEMLLRRCFPIKVSGYLKCPNHNSYKTGSLLLFPRHRIIR